MFDRILVAFDGSKASREASARAIELADEAGGEVYYIEVIDVTDFPEPIDREEVIDRIEMKRSEELEEAVENAKEKGVYEGSRVTRGVPHEEIIDRAEEVDADAVFMGQKGRTGVENVIGSTLHRVLEKSDRPVLSVNE